jgi:predicted secreted Zn-dependent protease
MKPALLAAALALCATAATAQDADEYYEGDILVINNWVTYEVTGSSLQEISDSMTANGPQGFWALTEWYVSWTGDCELTVESTITMPELSEDADLYDEEYAEWDRMIVALEEHELGHVANGIGFAQDVLDLGCQMDSMEEVRAPWLQADIDFDAETNHGINDGATLYID